MKTRVMVTSLAYLIAVFYLSSPLLSQDAPSEYRIQKKSFQPELSLNGVIVPAEMEQIIIRMKEFNGPLTVKSIIPSGTAIKKGTVLLSIDTEQIERQLQDAAYKADKFKNDIEQAKLKMKTDESAHQGELEKARLRLANAEKNFKNYKEIELPLARDKEDLSTKRSQAYLQYRETELKQLEEMYKESEIAGKTKEIVLERAKRDVELAKNSIALEQRDINYNRQTLVPKKIEDLTNEQKWSQDDFAILQSRIEADLAASKQSLNNLEFESKKFAESLARLKADRELFTIKADKDGIVVHGNLQQRLLTGKAPSLQAYEEIKEGDAVKPNEALFTLYSPDEYALMTSLPENSRYMVKSENRAELHINALPDKTFKATVSRIAPLANEVGPGGKMFSTSLAFKDSDSRLQAGLTCSIVFELAKLNDVIAIPADLVINREGKSFVSLRNGTSTAEQEVFVGACGANQVWITSGLKEGDVIVPKK